MDALKARLETDRRELADMLAATPDDRHLDLGFVAMLADINGALAALDSMKKEI